ncbi:MAG: chromate transporter, partial [Peptococcaceae bacterium]|nr:chromate transporter [Peptococcaceae bacterium]
LVTALLKTALKNKYVQAVVRGLKPCIIGIVLATGVYMIGCNLLEASAGAGLNVRALIMTVLLLMITYASKPILKKKPSPIMLIMISAVLGAVVYGI